MPVGALKIFLHLLQLLRSTKVYITRVATLQMLLHLLQLLRSTRIYITTVAALSMFLHLTILTIASKYQSKYNACWGT